MTNRDQAQAGLWQWLVDNAYISGNADYYATGEATAGEYVNALEVANRNITDEADRRTFWKSLVDAGAIKGNPDYYALNRAQPDEFANAFEVAEQAFLSGEADPQVAAQPQTDIGRGTAPNQQPPRSVANTTIPNDATVLIVRNTQGGANEYFLEADIGTVANPFQVLFSVGDRSDFERFFPNGLDVDQRTITDAQFEQEGLNARVSGVFDEIAGDTESIRSRIARQLAQLGLQDLPEWQRHPDIMQLTLQVANGDLAPSAFWTQAQTTQAFQERFPWYEQVRATSGATTIQGIVDAGIGLEQQMREAIRTVPGLSPADFDIPSLIGSGWNPAEVASLLNAQQEATPEGFQAVNQILRIQGLPEVDGDGYIDLIMGNAPQPVFEALADYERQVALEDQGIDLEATFGSLGEAVQRLGSGQGQEFGQDFTQQAIQAALDLGVAVDDVTLGRYGLTRAAIVESAFNQAGSAQTRQTLARLARERQARARGFTGSEAFTDRTGRLVIPGA